jgi:hypothetical protein
MTCCEGGGYKYGRIEGAVCECNVRQDLEVCASSTGGEEACIVCCLNHGFIGHGPGGDPCVCSD